MSGRAPARSRAPFRFASFVRLILSSSARWLQTIFRRSAARCFSAATPPARSCCLKARRRRSCTSCRRDGSSCSRPRRAAANRCCGCCARATCSTRWRSSTKARTRPARRPSRTARCTCYGGATCCASWPSDRASRWPSRVRLPARCAMPWRWSRTSPFET